MNRNMRGIFLFLFCFLFMLVFPLEKVETGESIVLVAEILQTEAEEEETRDVLYDDDAVTLLSTFSFQHDDGIPSRFNNGGRQLRVLNARVQLRSHALTTLVKRLTLLLSVHLTTLINHISQFYSSVKLLCWHHAADCYVFAFRQIII